MPAQNSLPKDSASNTLNQPTPISGLRPSKANVEGNNPKDRYGLAKVPFSLIPQTAKVFMAMGLGVGAGKYGPYNWRKEPVQSRVYLEAAERHLNLLLDGEDIDRDTGIHHGAFILSTIAIYLDAMVYGTLIDNRPMPGNTADLVAFFNRTPGEARTPSDLSKGFMKLFTDHFEQTKPTTKTTPDKGRRAAPKEQARKTMKKKGKRNAYRRT